MIPTSLLGRIRTHTGNSNTTNPLVYIATPSTTHAYVILFALADDVVRVQSIKHVQKNIVNPGSVRIGSTHSNQGLPP